MSHVRWNALAGGFALWLALACDGGSGGYYGGSGSNGSGGALTPDPSTAIPVDGTGGALPTLSLHVESDPALPITNGVIAMAGDSSLIVASDAEGHAVYLIDADTPVAITKIQFSADDFPGRIAASANKAFIILRRSGRVAVVDLITKAVTSTLNVCRLAEGLALDGASLHVACRDGELVSYDAATLEETRRLELDDDLRDVARRGDQLIVSRFRSAQLLFVDAQGAVARRIQPQLIAEGVVATQLSRFSVLESGQILAAVQASASVPLQADGTTVPKLGAYGALSSCGSIAAPAFVLLDPEALDPALISPQPNGQDPDVRYTVGAARFPGLAGMLDFTVHGSTVSVVVPANGLVVPKSSPNPVNLAASMPSFLEFEMSRLIGQDQVTVVEGEAILTEAQANQCLIIPGAHPTAVPVGVTARGADPILLMSSPLHLLWGNGRTIELDAKRRANTGFRLFHANTGVGISCASCHPEGREDGHVWSFAETGLRRTQNLEGGFDELAPFHWDAEFGRFDVLLEEVMVQRMGLGHHLLPEHVGALARFIDTFAASPAPAENFSEQSWKGRVPNAVVWHLSQRHAAVGRPSARRGHGRRLRDSTAHQLSPTRALSPRRLRRNGPRRVRHLRRRCAPAFFQRRRAHGSGCVSPDALMRSLRPARGVHSAPSHVANQQTSSNAKAKASAQAKAKAATQSSGAKKAKALAQADGGAPEQLSGKGAISFEATAASAGGVTVIRLPEIASKKLPSRGQVAAHCVINEHAGETVVEPDGEFGHWLRLDAKLQKAARVTPGKTVTVALEPSKDWPEPVVPKDLQKALADAPAKIQDIWQSITPMARWEWVRWVNATKNPATRQRRVEVSISKMNSGKRRPCCFNLAACTDPDLTKNGKLALD